LALWESLFDFSFIKNLNGLHSGFGLLADTAADLMAGFSDDLDESTSPVVAVVVVFVVGGGSSTLGDVLLLNIFSMKEKADDFDLVAFFSAGAGSTGLVFTLAKSPSDNSFFNVVFWDSGAGKLLKSDDLFAFSSLALIASILSFSSMSNELAGGRPQ